LDKIYVFEIGIIIGMKEMIKKDILRNNLPCNRFAEEFKEMDKEDQDLYLFLRGGFEAK